MKKTLVLRHPIMVNNQEVRELTYDIEEVTGLMFTEAEARRKTAAGSRNVSNTPVAEVDFGLHLYLGFAAILSVNPQCDFTDLERIKGADVAEVMRIGRTFFTPSEKSEGNSSDAHTETTPDPSTPQLQTSKSDG